MSNTSDAVYALESVQEVISQSYINYATLSVLVYETGNFALIEVHLHVPNTKLVISFEKEVHTYIIQS